MQSNVTNLVSLDISCVLAQAHLVQLMIPLINCIRCAWDNTCLADLCCFERFYSGDLIILRLLKSLKVALQTAKSL